MTRRPKAGAQPGKTRVDAGKPRPRQRIHFSLRPPKDPILRAWTGGTMTGGDVIEEEWAELRAPTWRRWLELVTSENRERERDPDRAWPPTGALHDRIEARVLRSRWARSEDYVRRWDARPTIVALAEQGLEEVAAFRERVPAVAEAISEPLAELERRLREVRGRARDKAAPWPSGVS